MSISIKRRAGLWAGAAVLAGAVSIAVVAGRHVPAEGASALPMVQVQVVKSRLVSDWVDYSGRLEAIDSVEIRPQVAGLLEAIHFRDGQQVKQGDVLFTIDPAPFKAKLEQAQADLTQARERKHFAASELARGQRLIAANAIARRDVDALDNAARESRAAVASAQAVTDRARLDVGYTRITAPISGRVSRAEVTRGNVVTAGGDATALTSIVTVDPIYASFNVDEQTYLHDIAARTGKDVPQVRVGLVGDRSYPHVGTLHSVDNQLDTRSGTIRMRALLQNSDDRMVPGLQARVRLQTSVPYQGVLVDEAVIATDQDRRFVLVVGKDDRVEHRQLELGSRQGTQRVVRAGLAAGDRVIVEGAQRVKPGDAVQVEVVATPAGAKPAPAKGEGQSS